MSIKAMTVPYDTDLFHQLQDLYLARSEFDSKDGPKFVKEVLCPMISDHGLSKVFGVVLLHRHADIGADQFLVEFNNCTTPWKYRGADIEEENAIGSQSVIFPTSWKLTEEGRWMPYEFSFSPTGPKGRNVVDLNGVQYREFLDQYAKTIQEAGFKEVIGVCSWPGDGFAGGLEFSDGTGNFWLVPGQFTEADRAHSTQTMWFNWNEIPGTQKVYCDCSCAYNSRGFHTLTHGGTHVSGVRSG